MPSEVLVNQLVGTHKNWVPHMYCRSTAEIPKLSLGAVFALHLVTLLPSITFQQHIIWRQETRERKKIHYLLFICNVGSSLSVTAPEMLLIVPV